MYIYLHLPFCTSICTYCDFPKLLYDKKFTDNYLKALEKEIKSRYQKEPVVSLYIGGGTPTCLEIHELEKLLQLTKLFKKQSKIEFTIESNIESLTEDKIKLLKKYGVNRISLGVQSLSNEVLKELNRHHTKEMVIEVVKLLKKNDIQNISVDYIYGVNNDLEIVKNDINEILKMDIPHISCYSLIIEDGTIFQIKNKRNIEEEIEQKMYKEIETILEQNNYHHYEISNYAKKGYESLHNLNYWENGEYYGFGLGAVSYLNNIRTTNTRNLSKYLKGYYMKEETEENKDIKISNALILGLRKIDGIVIPEFNQKYNCNIKDLYNIKDLLKQGLLEIDNNYLRIPKKYIYISNNILINFI